MRSRRRTSGRVGWTISGACSPGTRDRFRASWSSGPSVSSQSYLAIAAPSVVLHGDLHHENILAAERRPWLAIDPKGVVGEPAYEVGAFLRNPTSRLLDASRPQDVIARRVDLLSERLGLDRQRLLAFGFAQLVLAAWWMYEDHGDGWQPAIALAEAIEPATRRQRRGS